MYLPSVFINLSPDVNIFIYNLPVCYLYEDRVWSAMTIRPWTYHPMFFYEQKARAQRADRIDAQHKKKPGTESSGTHRSCRTLCQDSSYPCPDRWECWCSYDVSSAHLPFGRSFFSRLKISRRLHSKTYQYVPIFSGHGLLLHIDRRQLTPHVQDIWRWFSHVQ